MYHKQFHTLISDKLQQLKYGDVLLLQNTGRYKHLFSIVKQKPQDPFCMVSVNDNNHLESYFPKQDCTIMIKDEKLSSFICCLILKNEFEVARSRYEADKLQLIVTEHSISFINKAYSKNSEILTQKIENCMDIKELKLLCHQYQIDLQFEKEREIEKEPIVERIPQEDNREIENFTLELA